MATPKKKKAAPKKGSKKNVPAVKEEGTTAMATYAGYDDYVGRGFQNQTQEDIAIPFINVLQPMSPEVDEIEGARAGNLFNSVSQECYDEIQFVPAITQHVFVQWRKRDAGGGIVATHPLHSNIVKKAKAASTKFGSYETPGEEGAMDDLVETYYVFGVLSRDGEAAGMATMAFTSTKIKAYKAIMGRLNSFQLVLEDGRRVSPPLFAHCLNISTTKQKNALGSFYVPVIQPAVDNDVKASLLAPNDVRFLTAAECEKLVDSGEAKADVNSQRADTKGSSKDDEDEDLPF